MQVHVFARKFRGFKEISFECSKTLFLVGDNSSGKTSILHLVDLIFGKDLNDTPSFSGDLPIGRHDLFSPYFNYNPVTIGFSDRETGTSKVITVKRSPSDGWPAVVRFSTVTRNGCMAISLTNRQLRYKYKIIDDDEGILSSEQEILDYHDGKSGFNVIERPDSIHNANDLMDVLPHLPKEIVERIFPIIRLSISETLPEARHIGPVRGMPQRIYNFERVYKASGGHFASMLHDMNTADVEEFADSIRDFGVASGLFEDVSVRRITNSMNNAPLHMRVKRSNKWLELNQVGIGVSQVLPVLIESLFAKFYSKSNLILMQQPELHLHPKAQAALGDFLYIMHKAGQRYIVETHSDFLIDRFRSAMKKEESPEFKSVEIGFCENRISGNILHRIEIDDNGNYKNPPNSYRDFFIKEVLSTM